VKGEGRFAILFKNLNRVKQLSGLPIRRRRSLFVGKTFEANVFVKISPMYSNGAEGILVFLIISSFF